MTSPVYVQDSFRIRTGDTVGLNTDSGWAALENINATIDAGKVFRIRFHISETAGKGASQGFKIQANIGGAGWNTIEPDGGTATFSAVNKPSSQFSDAAATSTELLTNQGQTYVNGQGDWDNSATANPDDSETELEYALMIMQWYDGPAKVADSNTIQFRVVEADNTAFTTYSQTPTVTVNMPTGYIGGTMVESPNHLGPVADSNGNIYTIIEPSETDPKMMMIKSTDGGDSWAEIDGAGRPVQEDLECVDIQQVDDVLHILCHDGGAVYYHTFQTSDHASADQWGTIDNAVITGISLGTGQQTCALGVHSSGDKIAVYNKLSTSDRLFFKVDTGGGWGSEQNLEVTSGYNWHWATGIFDANGVFHVFYSGEDGVNGEIYHVDITEISTVWTLGSRESIDTAAGDGNDYDADIVPPVTWGSGASADVMMAYIDPDDDKLYSVVVTNNGSPGTRKALSDNAIAYNPGDADMPGFTNSRQPAASLSVNGTDVYCHFSDGTTLDLYRDTAADDGGWTTDVEELDGKTVQWVRSHTFTHSSGNGGKTVVGYIYDNGSDGGTGHIWYGELEISTGTEYTQSAAGSLTTGGVVKKRAGKGLAGALTSAGVIVKQTSKSLAGSLASAGDVVKRTATSLAGSLTPAGVVAASKVALQSLAGSLSSSGALVKQTSTSLAGSLTTAGDVVKQTATGLAGSLTSAGALVKQTGKGLAGTVTPAGALASFKAALVALAGSLTTSGALVKQTGKGLAGNLTSAGDIVKETAKSLAGSLTSSGVLDPVKQAAGLFYQSVAGSLTPAGAVVKQTGKGLAGALTTSGNAAKGMYLALAGSLTSSGTVAKGMYLSLAGTLTSSGVVSTLATFRAVLAGALTSAGTVTKQTAKGLAGAVSSTGAVVKRTGKGLAGTLTSSGIVTSLKNPIQDVIALTLRARDFSLSLVSRAFGLRLRSRSTDLTVKERMDQGE
jgi:hypothetical protein